MEIPNIKALILKPRATFEEMLSEADWKRGLIAWILFSFIGIALYFLLAAAAKMDYIVMSFGIGSGLVDLSSMAVRLMIFFSAFIILTGLSHLGAKLMKGTGTFSSTLGLFGYANIVTSIKATFSGFLTVFYSFFIYSGMKNIVMHGTMNVQSIAYLTYISIVAVLVFDFWLVWVQSAALSVVHEIARWKSLGLIIIANFIIGFLILHASRLVSGGVL